MAAAASKPKRSASSKEYRCNLCGRIFDSAETLNSHKRIDHSQEGRQTPAGVG
jgi:hypothetical protein